MRESLAHRSGRTDWWEKKGEVRSLKHRPSTHRRKIPTSVSLLASYCLSRCGLEDSANRFLRKGNGKANTHKKGVVLQAAGRAIPPKTVLRTTRISWRFEAAPEFGRRYDRATRRLRRSSLSSFEPRSRQLRLPLHSSLLLESRDWS